jgi:hypothetical protein
MTSSTSRNNEPKPVTAPQEDRTTWARYWTHWYNKHMAEAAEAKRLAESYGASFPSEKRMTREQAQALKSFKHYCNCGGFAWQMNGRSQEQPHMDWCPQYDEYAEWWAAMHATDRGSNQC